MKKIGFIGVGNIGIGMAKSFLREGFELTVYDIRRGRPPTIFPFLIRIFAPLYS